MIVQETIGDLVRTYSDAGFYVHGGMPEEDYIEAIDPISMNRTYIETDIPIESETKDSLNAEDMAYAEAMKSARECVMKMYYINVFNLILLNLLGFQLMLLHYGHEY